MKQVMGLLPRRTKRVIKWGSHIPLHRAILKTFPIHGILELGAGIYSTKEFFSTSQRVISIENDSEWVKKMRTLVKEDSTHKIVHHVLDNKNIQNGTLYGQVSDDEVKNAVSFYKQYINDDVNMMFVDGYACFRQPALQNLYGCFDVITYHDTEKPKLYGYNHFRNSLGYLHFVEKTFIAHTGLLIKLDFKECIPLLMENLKKECEIHADYLNVEATVNIEEKKQ